jgi:alpha-tubulin suppressor-like RCC1 family protein
VVGVAAGGNFTCAWSNAGRVSCWGENGNGQLGTGRRTGARRRPTPTSPASSTWWLAPNHACARHSDGSVSCWGDNSAQQLGLGDGMGGNRPVPAKLMTLARVAGLAAGGRHTCARLPDGALNCWGRNMNGQLGDGTTVSQDKPGAVPTLENNVKQVAGRPPPTPARRSPTAASRAGARFRNGRHPAHGAAMQLLPAPVPGVAMASRVAAGDSHACAISNGDVFCWGMNDLGQLGRQGAGPHAGRHPRGRERRRDLWAGNNHTCARLEDGSARCWGAGASGSWDHVVDAGTRSCRRRARLEAAGGRDAPHLRP